MGGKRKAMTLGKRAKTTLKLLRRRFNSATTTRKLRVTCNVGRAQGGRCFEQQWAQIQRVAFALLEHYQLSGEGVAAMKKHRLKMSDSPRLGLSARRLWAHSLDS
jgi:hypothetical protein